MDAAVLDELLQGDAGDFPAHRVEAGDGDGLRRVVDDQIHAGHGLQRADVAALAADDAALHLVIGQGNHRDGGFGHMVGGAALNGQGQDLLGAGVGLLLELGLDLPHLHGRLMGDLLGKLVDEVVLGLLGGEAGDALQHLHLGLLDGGHLVPGLVQLGQLALQGVLLLLDVLGLAVQVLFLLLEPPLLLLQIGPALLHLALILGGSAVGGGGVGPPFFFWVWGWDGDWFWGAGITQAMIISIKGPTHLHILDFSKFFFHEMDARAPARSWAERTKFEELTPRSSKYYTLSILSLRRPSVKNIPVRNQFLRLWASKGSGQGVVLPHPVGHLHHPVLRAGVPDDHPLDAGVDDEAAAHGAGGGAGNQRPVSGSTQAM